MTRPLRIQYANAFYHVTCRGNAREDVFCDDKDRKTFLNILARSADTFEVEILAFVLMNNHFHLLIKTPRANLAEFMRQFNISYTSYFNRRHKRVGHLYQGRYKAFLIEADNYLLEVSRYVHLNPVRTKPQEGALAKGALLFLKDYPWSSLSGYVKKNKRDSFVNYQEVLSYMGGNSSISSRRYTKFVLDGLEKGVRDPFVLAQGHGILGKSSFVEKMKERFINHELSDREQPQLRRLRSLCISPEELIEAILKITGISSEDIMSKRSLRTERPILMELLYRYCSLSQREIGVHMGGVDYSAVSLARRRLRERLEKDKILARRLEEIKSALQNIISNK
jgi:REP element-mobilizing transposase RayT